MVNKRTLLVLLCCIVPAITGWSGCSHYKTRYKAITHPTLTTDINNSITGLYPDRFKAIHHVILTLAGKDYVLDGYLFIDRPHREIKLIAQNDLGGILFDVHYIQGVKKLIRTNVDLLKKKWIEKSALRDLEVLYFKEPFPSPDLYSDPRGDLILSQKQGRITRELSYKPVNGSAAGYRPNEIRHLENGKCIYTVTLTYGTNAGHQYPEQILIQDTKMRYRLQINVRYFM